MAQKSRSALQTTIDANLPDNTSREISPADTRETQTDLNDSAFNITTDDSDDITEGASNLFLTTTERGKLTNITVTQAVDLDTMEADIAALSGAVVLKGSWDASAGTFPGSGSASKGWSYIVTTSGTVDGVSFTQNDRIVALIDNASVNTYTGNWLKLDYTDQVLSVAGKTGAVTLDADDVSETSTKKWLTTSTQTIAGAKTFSTAVNAFREATQKTSSLTIDAEEMNKFLYFDISGAVTITVNDTSASAASTGYEVDVFWSTDSGSNSVTFATGGSQSIISKDSALALSAIGSAATLKYLGSNTWALIGDLS